jgi:hypothetical protein
MKQHIKTILAYFILASIILGCGLCSTADKLTKGKSVKYEVSGSSGLVSVTIYNATGGIEQYNDVTTPWDKTIFMKDGFMYVSAQNQKERGTVKVKIYVDGDLIKESSSEGEYCIATASETLK